MISIATALSLLSRLVQRAINTRECAKTARRVPLRKVIVTYDQTSIPGSNKRLLVVCITRNRNEL